MLYTDPPSPDQAANPYEASQSGLTTQQTPEQKALEQFLLARRGSTPTTTTPSGTSS